MIIIKRSKTQKKRKEYGEIKDREEAEEEKCVIDNIVYR